MIGGILGIFIAGGFDSVGFIVGLLLLVGDCDGGMDDDDDDDDDGTLVVVDGELVVEDC